MCNLSTAYIDQWVHIWCKNSLIRYWFIAHDIHIKYIHFIHKQRIRTLFDQFSVCHLFLTHPSFVFTSVIASHSRHRSNDAIQSNGLLTEHTYTYINAWIHRDASILTQYIMPTARKYWCNVMSSIPLHTNFSLLAFGIHRWAISCRTIFPN